MMMELVPPTATGIKEILMLFSRGLRIYVSTNLSDGLETEIKGFIIQFAIDENAAILKSMFSSLLNRSRFQEVRSGPHVPWTEA